ncbi:hypothetical protein TYRP_004239 [Tyrophagus putrescentiae]|nr:hypothetical protein TYRP_004239 [Tyrophagus putrescentiae]
MVLLGRVLLSSSEEVEERMQAWARLQKELAQISSRNVDTVQANVNAHIGENLLPTKGTVRAGDGGRGDVPIGSAVGHC